jgi:hypothetical protein
MHHGRQVRGESDREIQCGHAEEVGCHGGTDVQRFGDEQVGTLGAEDLEHRGDSRGRGDVGEHRDDLIHPAQCRVATRHLVLGPVQIHVRRQTRNGP